MGGAAATWFCKSKPTRVKMRVAPVLQSEAPAPTSHPRRAGVPTTDRRQERYSIEKDPSGLPFTTASRQTAGPSPNGPVGSGFGTRKVRFRLSQLVWLRSSRGVARSRLYYPWARGGGACGRWFLGRMFRGFDYWVQEFTARGRIPEDGVTESPGQGWTRMPGQSGPELLEGPTRFAGAPFRSAGDLGTYRQGDVTSAGSCFKPANLFAPKFQRKRFKIKQFGRFQCVYLVQSLHAPHSKEVNAARARRLAR